jgi:hypothetical protein
MKKLILTLLTLVILQVGFSQNYKFGKVSKEEFQETFYPLDSSAHAAYLFKKRRTYTSYQGAAGIKLVTEVQVRLKIYSQEGFDYASEQISLYGGGSTGEKASNLKGVTYNLVNGEIVKSKLDKKNVFVEQKNEDWKIKKFTMPNIKEGSVIEWSYKIYSPHYSYIDDIIVQYEIPVKKYETVVQLLEYYTFNKRQKGYYPFKILESRKRNTDFESNDKIIEINEENVPAIIEEPYVNNMKNYTSSLILEVSRLEIPGIQYKNFATSWEAIAKNIYKSLSFGSELKKTKHLKDDVEILKSQLTSDNDKIFGGLEFIKNKIKWNGNYGKYTEKGLRKSYNESSGNASDVNLNLVAVLRELGVNANPTLVSTRNNGVPLFPTAKGFNYVIAVVETEQGKVLLDATEKYSLPNLLPLRSMNWKGLIVRDDYSTNFINLESSSSISLEEHSLSYKILEDGLIEGMNRVRYKNSSALNYRIKYGSLSEESIISKTESNNNDIEILNFRLSNVNKLSKPVVEMYKFEKEDGVEVIGNKMYVTPLLFSATTENPFKLDNREFPIDFGTPYEEKVIVSVQLPEGYTAESVPEDLAIGMSEDLGTFIYSVKNQGNKIQIISDDKINRGSNAATYYSEIKELFKQIVAKQTEKIVLSKN